MSPKLELYHISELLCISEVPGDPNRIVEKNKITFQNVSKDHIQVVQCNATNKHGYIYTNAYLNVLSKSGPSPDIAVVDVFSYYVLRCKYRDSHVINM